MNDIIWFSEKVIKFCSKQKYKRVGASTEQEFSQVAFRLYGCFALQDLSLEQITEVTNCILYARAEPKQEECKEYEFKIKSDIQKIFLALDSFLGDTDPYFDEDMTDEDIREEEPIFWAAKELAKLFQ